MEQDLLNKKIAVAMSGGVDSSLAAALLRARGAEVIGFTLQLYDHGKAQKSKAQKSSKTCCAGQDIHDAKQVAAELNIPHYVLDYQSYFEHEVIADFADSYARGQTPLPCVRCNERIKFSRLLEFAKDLGVQAFATGHYIRKLGDSLYQACDCERDQSYFLWTLTKAQLAFSLFPLGDLKKTEVRALAAEYNLSVADKRDSQDICFIPSGHYSDLVRFLRPEVQRAGDIVDLAGRVIGRHQGLYQFTIGQRRGLGISNASNTKPLYVVGLDVEHARLILGDRSDCAVRRLSLSGVHWINAPSDGSVWVKLRSTQRPVLAFVQGSEVFLTKPEMGVASGQACVFYQKDKKGLKILGGGWISETDLAQKVKSVLYSSRDVRQIRGALSS